MMLKAVRRDGLLAEGRPVTVLFSGGRDSTCLLDLAVRIAGQASVSALHVNYGLRDSEETAAYCHQRELPWREDETNASIQFARGRVRHGLVPALEAVHPAAVANVLAVAEVLRDEAAVLDALVDAVLEGREEIELERL